MARRKGDFTLFIGDFPYTAEGKRSQVHAQNRIIRENEGFTPLTCATPTCAVWDDHDFGPNDCDGTHPNAKEALTAFKEYWANPGYGEPGNPGIYSSFVIGDVEVFLLDGRYHSRQSEDAPTMLGARQFQWLCDGLTRSTARYKLLVSGTPFARVKRDCWAGRFYVAERERLFKFIAETQTT
jgi:alkaline phosphatase D